MLQFKIVTKKFADLGLIKDLLLNSFPGRERVPMGFLLWRAKKEYVDFLAYYDDDRFIGFTYIVSDTDMIFILYLAVINDARSKGYGSQILDLLTARHPGKRQVLDIEAIDVSVPNNAQRIRRREFYAKNGFQQTDLIMTILGVTYEILIKDGGCTAEEFVAVYKKFTSPFLSHFVKMDIKSI